MRSTTHFLGLALLGLVLSSCDDQPLGLANAIEGSFAGAVHAAPPSKGPLFGDWHRLNPGLDVASSEHEVMRLVEQHHAWVGRYDKKPEPGLGFRNPPERTSGRFSGQEAADFVCLPGFPFYPCDDVVFVVEGTMHFDPPDGPPFAVIEQHIVVREPTGEEVLWVYWVDAPEDRPEDFVCPWFHTFEEALERNPLPPQFDCVVGVSGS